MMLVNIDSVINLFGISDKDIYAKETIEDALCDGTLEIIKLEQKKGKWIGDEAYARRCSCCGKVTVDEDEYFGNFCQWCGADMRGEQDE